jgi:hypothetical protein
VIDEVRGGCQGAPALYLLGARTLNGAIVFDAQTVLWNKRLAQRVADKEIPSLRWGG